MSLKVIKSGILDTMQDMGRNRYQYLGINPGGAMDKFAAQVSNILVGNDVDEAIIEMHFPAASFLFEQETIISISGADFTPTINGEAISILHPVIVSKNSILQLNKVKSGARCYLALRDKFNIPQWLDSYSTNLKATAGGWQGRALRKDDTITFKTNGNYTSHLSQKDFIVLPWKADVSWNQLQEDTLKVITGNEWDWLNDESKKTFLSQSYNISNVSDRMGYRLQGEKISTTLATELISSAVSFGTIQLLPDGQLIVLMADHQTTGGYPRVAHIVTAQLSQLAQMRTGEKIQFSMTDHKTAEAMLIEQQQHLLQLQNACKFKLEEFFKT
jgi:antagonist of KipI